MNAHYILTLSLVKAYTAYLAVGGEWKEERAAKAEVLWHDRH